MTVSMLLLYHVVTARLYDASLWQLYFIIYQYYCGYNYIVVAARI